jgi:ribosomal protein L12E/L44/L45/RPP1/RPP2
MITAATDLKNVLGSTNCNISDTDLTRLIETLKGKDINKLIASGLTKIGGSGSAPAVNAGSKPAAQ